MIEPHQTTPESAPSAAPLGFDSTERHSEAWACKRINELTEQLQAANRQLKELQTWSSKASTLLQQAADGEADQDTTPYAIHQFLTDH